MVPGGSGSQISRQLTPDGGKIVSPMHRPPLSPENIPGTHFCYRLSQPQGHSETGRIMSMKNSNDTIGNGTRHLPVCTVVSQPTAPPRTPNHTLIIHNYISHDKQRFRSDLHTYTGNTHISTHTSFVKQPHT